MENQILNSDLHTTTHKFKVLQNSYNVKSNHFYMEILFNVSGKAKISIGSNTFEMNKDDIIYIRPNEYYSIEPSQYTIVSLIINQNMINGFDSNKSLFFSCNSTIEANKTLFLKIRSTFVSFLKSELTIIEDKTLLSYSFLYSIINELNQNFFTNISLNDSDNKHYDRIFNIISYIEKHYNESLSLEKLSDEFHLTIPYLSSFFQKNLKTNFKDYYDNIKLRHAKELMITTNLSLEEIAYKSGFQSSQTFFRVFKNKEGITPNNYKKDNERSEIINEENELSALLSTYSLKEYEYNERIKLTDSISFNNTLFINNKPYQKILGFGDARDILYANVQKAALETYNNVKFEYGLIRNIFADEMSILSVRGKETSYSFSLVTEVLNFLLDLKLKPIIELNYMPSLIAKKQNKPYSFINRFSPYEPENISDWKELVNKFIAYLISYYGAETVSQWIIVPWLNPDTGKDLFGFEKDEDFFKFYKETYTVIKQLIPDIQISSPEFLPLTQNSKKFIESFYEWVIKNNCCPQIISYSCYLEENFDLNNTFSKDPDKFNHAIDYMRNLANKFHISYQPQFILSYNLSLSHYNPILDTAYMGPFVCKNAIENLNKIDAFCYWKLLDFEYIRDNADFPGKIGLYLKEGIQKPQMLAHTFLSFLLKKVIGIGKGYVVTKNNDDNLIVILLYNYHHYSNNFAEGKMTKDLENNRYLPFNNPKEIDFSLDIKGLDNFKYAKISKYLTNRKYGSIYDAWIEMGQPVLETQDKSRYELLKGLSNPLFKTYDSPIIDGVLKIHEQVSYFEIKTLYIKLKKS